MVRISQRVALLHKYWAENGVLTFTSTSFKPLNKYYKISTLKFTFKYIFLFHSQYKVSFSAIISHLTQRYFLAIL